MKTKSFAKWPEGTTGLSDDTTFDTHETESAAAAVCRMLERDGFGGEGKIFPLMTWTAPA